MASRTRIGKKNRVFTTSSEPPSEVFSSKESCKGPLTQTTLQTNISSSLSKTSNVQVPTPLSQPLRVSVSFSQTQPQLNSSQATTLTHENILNSNNSHSLKRKGRGPTRVEGIDDIINVAGKILLEISKKLRRAIGNRQAHFASGCGYVIRSFAPLCYKRWIDIPNEEKHKLYDRILAKFKLDLTVQHVHKSVNDTLARRYPDYRCRLKEKYFNGKILDDAMKNCPTDIKQDDWDWLCQYWYTPEFQERMLQIKEQLVPEGSNAPH
ncbi:Anaphase-promoting complex subunit 6 [Olea europaea subsp. europaea]|uniref:Anaphase-promoting complex subunit 6 n=1 Tax=Olea europaea subsp. europaea TaxID=158383 RepID=A0A8S0TYA7_OLEEU|nr:Anaphase-promoting complex subunit 6 [Olea europaea subsp. europaea]